MGRELRLGFAMGGGVSLGTFSGAALAEAIKLAVLRGGYEDENGDVQRYDRVTIDVFSGASAGAMALSLMLRTLAERSEAQEQRARERLEGELGDEVAAQFAALDDEAKQDTIAAQVVQDAQERVWVEEVSIDRLLAYPANNTDHRSPVTGRVGPGPGASAAERLRYAAGLLDRGAVDGIARDALGFEEPLDLSNRRLLSDRVLFACTLSNVTPILIDARGDLEAHEAGYLGLADGLTSYAHREVRVFDLSFTERSPDWPSRWVRYHAGDKVVDPERGIGDVRGKSAWSRIAATAIACGAFPFAFEPVVLTRGRYEYGDLWPDRLGDAGIDAYPFTYVDGGAFNNEPIREAFRMAAFMDATDPERDFDRRIVFVDPNVAPTDTSFRVPVHNTWLLQEPNRFGTFDGYDLLRAASLDRLAPHAGSIVAAILHEATFIEEDKVYGARRRFEERDVVRHILPGILTTEPTAGDFDALADFCRRRLAERARSKAMPTGGLTLAAELRRVIAEEPDLLPDLQGRAHRWDAHARPADHDHADQWIRALAFVALDLAMDMAGKRENARLVAIAPVIGVKDGPGRARPVRLPGGAVSGFGGFTSETAGRFETALARHCAREFLEAAGMVAPATDPPPRPIWGPGQETDYRRDLQRGLGLLAGRVGDTIRQSHLVAIFPGIDGVLKKTVANIAENKVRLLGEPPPVRTRFEFRVFVSDKRFELDGGGVADRDLSPIRVQGQGQAQAQGGNGEGRLALVTFADWDHEDRAWSGPHVGPDGHLRIHRDGWGPLPDRLFCTAAMPTEQEVRQALLWPNGRFTGELDAEAHEGESAVDGFWGVEAGVGGLEDGVLG